MEERRLNAPSESSEKQAYKTGYAEGYKAAIQHVMTGTQLLLDSLTSQDKNNG